MGGRGTFASGRNVTFSYQTVGKIEGIKVLQGMSGVHGLPEESHSSRAYISLTHRGTVKQIRVYHSDLTAKMDIEYSMHQGRMMLHAHDYERGERQSARTLRKTEYEKYKKFFGGKQ